MCKINVKLSLNELKALNLLGINTSEEIRKLQTTEDILISFLDNVLIIHRYHDKHLENKYLHRIKKHLYGISHDDLVREVYLNETSDSFRFNLVAKMIQMIDGLLNETLIEYHDGYLEQYMTAFLSFERDIRLSFGENE